MVALLELLYQHKDAILETVLTRDQATTYKQKPRYQVINDTHAQVVDYEQDNTSN